MIGPNLVLRFLLELVAFGAPAAWGISVGGAGPILVGLVGSALVMAVWGVFRVPHDPGPAPVAVPGLVRLAIEVGCFALGVTSLAAAGWGVEALAFGVLLFAHYAFSFPRVLWLINHP